MPGVLYYNGDILTMEPQLYAPAILVESGRLLTHTAILPHMPARWR